jgi:chromate transporter
MLDGLGLAETTPGPLIMVLQFVGFLGGWNHPGSMSPLLAATLGAAITTWATFVPCFLWIFLGAPHIEQLRGKRAFNAALAAVTAAVVGVILNLAVWFGTHILFPSGDVAWLSIAIAAAAFAAMQWLRVGIIPTILGAGAVGLAASLF